MRIPRAEPATPRTIVLNASSANTVFFDAPIERIVAMSLRRSKMLNSMAL